MGPVQPRALLAPRPRTAPRHPGPYRTRVSSCSHARPHTPLGDPEGHPLPPDQRTAPAPDPRQHGTVRRPPQPRALPCLCHPHRQ
ncbi:hypothetical protein SLI_4248 [Streptomyces lividans 1326]|uniref:Uncharacterized protein n=1 Tax=Streptomyces lividans 1326 TaxID=1200984 RepID=A0A7U9DRU0_STRLI|nr:hypothetical protein SLI_4248 [Streptomyces lividans 1326]